MLTKGSSAVPALIYCIDSLAELCQYSHAHRQTCPLAARQPSSRRPSSLFAFSMRCRAEFRANHRCSPVIDRPTIYEYSEQLPQSVYLSLAFDSTLWRPNNCSWQTVSFLSRSAVSAKTVNRLCRVFGILVWGVRTKATRASHALRYLQLTSTNCLFLHQFCRRKTFWLPSILTPMSNIEWRPTYFSSSDSSR